MPTITVEGPPIDIERKRELVKRLTEAAIKIYKIERLTEAAIKIYKIEHITVLIRENPPENVGVNGQLIADRKRPK